MCSDQGCGSGCFVNRFHTYRFRFQQHLDSIRAWTLTEPGLHLIYELADKHDYQNQQLTIYKGTLLVKMIAKVSICQHGTATLFLQKTQPRKLSSTHINTNSTYNNLTFARGFLRWGASPPQEVLKSISGGAGEGEICGGKR